MRLRRRDLLLSIGVGVVVAACGAPAAPTAAPTKPAVEPTKPAAPAATVAPAASAPPAAKPTEAAIPAEPTKPAVAATTAPAATTVPMAKPAATPQAAALRIALANDEAALTPFNYRFGLGLQIMYLIYDTLMYTDADNQPKPLMAREVTVAPDATSYTIALRPGQKWHDGKPLTADDVKFTYEYIPKVGGSIAAPLRNVGEITVTGPDALTIKLKAPSAVLPLQTLAATPIIPKHIWESVDPTKAKEATHKIGSGAYKLLEASPDNGYRLQANAEHMLGAPAVGELFFPVIKDQNTAFQALRAGEIQSVWRVLPAEQVAQFSQPPLKVAKGPGYAATMLQINAERPPFDRKEVRQALDLAIDKKALVETLLLGQGVAATPGFVHPQSPVHDASVVVRFDPAKAKQLLDGIGATAGGDGVRTLDGKKMEYTLHVYANSPLRIRAAELIAARLKEVGILATVKAADAAAVDDLVWPGFDVTKGRNYDLAMWGWSAPVQIDSSRLIDLVHSDQKLGIFNLGALKSADADKLADQLRVEVAEAKRKELLQGLERQIATDLPFVMLYYEDGLYAYRPQSYDSWIFQKGQGIFTRLSFLPGLR